MPASDRVSHVHDWFHLLRYWFTCHTICGHPAGILGRLKGADRETVAVVLGREAS